MKSNSRCLSKNNCHQDLSEPIHWESWAHPEYPPYAIQELELAKKLLYNMECGSPV